MLFLEVTTMKKSGVYVHMYKSVHMQMMCMEKNYSGRKKKFFLEVVPPAYYTTNAKYAFPARNSAAKQPVKGGSSGGSRVWPVMHAVNSLYYLHTAPRLLPQHNVIFSTCMVGYIRSSSLHTLTVNM